MTQFNTPYERENAPRGGPDIPKPGPRPGQPYVEEVFESETFTAGPGGAGSSPYTTLPGWQMQQPFSQTPSGQWVPVSHWSPKSKLAAGLFGILLGAFGAHNFYLGFTGKAVAQLLITVLTLGLLSWVSAIWGLIEGILILSSQTGTLWDQDALGYPMLPIGVQG